jgi:hypothetical protein
MFHDLKNEILNIKDFSSNIFVNYSRNNYLTQNIIQKNYSTEKEDITSISSETKTDEINNSILRLKSRRNSDIENDYLELNTNLTEEKNSFVSFKNGIVRIKNKEIEDSK